MPRNAVVPRFQPRADSPGTVAPAPADVHCSTLKIALVIQNAEPQRGGAERYTLNLAADLVGRGHQVYLLAQRFARNVEPAIQVRLDGAAGTRFRRYEVLQHSLAHHLTLANYDVVHAMLPVWRCDIYQPHAGIEAENFVTAHLKHPSGVGRLLARMGNQLNPKRRLFAQVEREMIMGRHPPLILCLSDYVRQSAMRHYPTRANRMSILHNGVDLARFDPAARPDAGVQLRQKLRIPPTAIMALMIAQDFRRKGLRTALHALASLSPAQQSRTVLVIVGREKPDPYQRLAARLGLADRTLFAGSTDDPYAFYRAADLFILPTSHDPCSLVVLESLAMGVPVLTTKMNGAGELIVPGQQGQVIANPADAPAFAAAWKNLLDPTTLRLSRQACLDLRPRIAQAQHVTQILRLYETVHGA